MSMERIQYLPQDTRVTFELHGTLPIFREQYVSPQVGKVTLKGLFNASAHIELLDGTRFRTLSVRRGDKLANELIYPLVRLPGKTEVALLRTPLRLPTGTIPRLRFTTTFDEQPYVFRQNSPGRRGFELWDGMEMQKLVERDTRAALMPDLTVLTPVPVLLVLLFPWLDSQTITYRQP